MPRYFFDVHSGGAVIPDKEGQILPDRSAAREEAMATLPEFAARKISKDGDSQQYVVVARDESGGAVYKATLSYFGLWLDKPLS